MRGSPKNVYKMPSLQRIHHLLVARVSSQALNDEHTCQLTGSLAVATETASSGPSLPESEKMDKVKSDAQKTREKSRKARRAANQKKRKAEKAREALGEGVPLDSTILEAENYSDDLGTGGVIEITGWEHRQEIELTRRDSEPSCYSLFSLLDPITGGEDQAGLSRSASFGPDYTSVPETQA